MEDWPFKVNEVPLHCLDVITYDDCNKQFRVWMQEETFHQESINKFGQDFTESLKKTVGCLVADSTTGWLQIGTAFIVKVPEANTLSFEDSKIKALLLTSAHVFTKPFSISGDCPELHFTLAPNLRPATLDSYSKYKIRKLFQFEPFQSNSFIDPESKTPFMMPDDVEIIAIMENDPDHKMKTLGNEFIALEYNHKIEDEKLPVLVVGYPGAFTRATTEQFAPIISNQLQLANEANDLRSKLLAGFRVFSIGEILGYNDTCIAFTSSTWQGMSGGPLCVYSEEKKKLCFCGVYAGSAAVIFQSFLSKLMFCLQGHPISLQKDDLPKLPMRHEETLGLKFWLYALRKVFLPLCNCSDLGQYARALEESVSNLLSLSESHNYSVEHNLAIIGGERFNDVIIRLLRIDSSGQGLEDVFDCFKKYEKGSIIFNENESRKRALSFAKYNSKDKGLEYILNMVNDALSIVTEIEDEFKKYEQLEDRYQEEIMKPSMTLITGWNTILK